MATYNTSQPIPVVGDADCRYCARYDAPCGRHENKIDHAKLQEALRGPSEDPAFPTADAHPTSDRKGTIVYLGDASWLDINADGSLWFHPSSLGEATVVGRGGTIEEVFKAARLFVTQYSVWLQTHRLLTRLENDVPSGVAHYAVEGAKKALRELERKAYTIDYFYGS